MATKSLCSIDGCSNTARSRGYCSTHYSRWRIHGDASFLACPPNGTLAEWIIRHSTHEGEECLIWPFSRNPSGYACQVIMDGVSAYAHDHMCHISHGPKPTPSHEVAHSCGNGRIGCVHPKHVRWSTHVDNMADMVAHGRTNRGEKCPSATLTEKDVIAIRSLIPIMKHKDIAAMFGITRPTVSLIKSRRTWAWLE